MSLNIRSATLSDAGILFDMMRELSAHHGEEFLATPEKITLNLLQHSEDFTTLIAEWNGAVAGYAMAHAAFEASVAERGLYLSDLLVRSGYRRHGIARALVANLAAQAKRNGQTFLWWVVLAGNQEGGKFYETLGTKSEKPIVHALIEDAFNALAKEGA